VGDELLARDVALRFKGSALDADRTTAFLANEANHLVVAEVGSEVAGYLLAYLLDRLDRSNEQLLVYDVEVIPERRRLGIGSALMR
jgi:ribosomal protein S18 acetylase RimI-like enzyme